ncbi:MAG: hypothetical protein N5P05_001947 [Chroococcopsis gigantea SAG 12.99]|jgi:carbon dioxide concentrating mechanism protein CcmN|nr:hypothetical protein [Chroococcopsis gigantea SAG 12.99]
MFMPLPPVNTISTSEIYVSGDVSIHESAVVAPGVILQAADDSRIVIGAGACVGLGVILNAYQGSISVGSGAILGAGVLMVGHGDIGAGACIGSTTTIFNASIQSGTVIPSGSLVGDFGRVAPEENQTQDYKATESMKTSGPQPEPPPPDAPEAPVHEERAVIPADTVVVGQTYINQLLLTLFPNRQNSNGSNPNQK